MFAQSRFSGLPGHMSGERRLRAVDATTVQEPGATGTDWRVHYSICIPEMRCDFYQITDTSGGETYKRIPVMPGDILLGDRGYCHREGVAHVVSQKGDVVARLNSTSFPLLNSKGGCFHILRHLRQLEGTSSGEWVTYFEASGKRLRGRLCAIRKSRVAADRANLKIQREAAKRKTLVRPETLESAEYIYVFTTLDSKTAGTTDILDLYRARWQIELCFKRLKSLLQLGHVPKRSDDSAHAWIEAKLLTVLMIEALLNQARLFSTWGYTLTPPQPLA